MMQKSKLFFILFFVLCCIQTISFPVLANTQCKATIAINPLTGEVLHQHNATALIPPASLTKIMTLLMVFDALETKKLRLTDMVKISKKAANQEPGKLGLCAGSYISVEHIILSLITKSANDMACAVAEHLGGTEEAFANYMTQRAHEFGMLNTTFKNASGLPHIKQITTARDMAILGLVTLKHYQKYFHLFSVRQFCYNKRCHINHNYRLLSQHKYKFNGIKTGYVHASGFNVIATHEDKSSPVLIVALGGKTPALRDKYVLEVLQKIKTDVPVTTAKTNRSNSPTYISLNIATPSYDQPKKYSLILGYYGSKLRAETVAKDALGRTTFFENKNISTKRVRVGGRYLYQVSIDNLSKTHVEQAYSILAYFNIAASITEQTS